MTNPPDTSVTERVARAIAHAEKYDTPKDNDPRRRYTPAQMEIACRAAISSMPALEEENAPSVHGNCILGDECGNLTRKDGSEGVEERAERIAAKVLEQVHGGECVSVDRAGPVYLAALAALKEGASREG